jgi:hypothetical protein
MITGVIAALVFHACSRAALLRTITTQRTMDASSGSYTKERIPVMTRNTNLEKSDHACELTLVDESQIPYTDSSSPLSRLRKGIVVDTRIQAEVVNETGETVTGTITKLSDTGLQLTTSRQMLDCLQDGFLGLIKCKPTTIQLRFSLPSNLEPFDSVSALCMTTHARKTRRNTARIGMKFIEFSEGEDTLAEYLLFKEVIG